jgi:hypothetical protein
MANKNFKGWACISFVGYLSHDFYIKPASVGNKSSRSIHAEGRGNT